MICLVNDWRLIGFHDRFYKRILTFYSVLFSLRYWHNGSTYLRWISPSLMIAEKHEELATSSGHSRCLPVICHMNIVGRGKAFNSLTCSVKIHIVHVLNSQHTNWKSVLVHTVRKLPYSWWTNPTPYNTAQKYYIHRIKCDWFTYIPKKYKIYF